MEKPSAFHELINEVRARGYYRRPTARIVSELALLIIVTVCSAIVYFTCDNAIARACAVFLTAWGLVAIPVNTHTTSHYATSDKRWVNDFLVFFGMPFCIGLSATYWWHSHIEVHHPHPNVIGLDDDQHYGRLFARTRDALDRSTGIWHFYYRYLQSPALAVLLLGNGIKMPLTSWIYLFRQLHDPGRRKARHWIDLACLVMHFSVTTILPSLFLGFEPVIVFRLLVTACHGYTMLAVLGPSHLAAPAICVATPPAPSDSAAWQIVSTVNYRTGWIGRLICAGTGYHIEHHLFPGVAHVYYPEISELVRRYCEREGLPYNSFSWEGAILRCFATMSNPPEVLPRWPAPTGPRTAEPSSQPSLSNFRDSSGLSKDSASAA